MDELANPMNPAPEASAPGSANPRIRPSDAATLILIDRKNRTPKFLMGKRNARLKFMPGNFVFPGGRIERGDGAMPVVGALHARAEQALMALVPRRSAERGRALALAAIREVYEETGILLGSREYGPPETIPNAGWEAFRQHGVLPDLEALQVVARAVTPPNRNRQFDTRFFAIDRRAIAHVTEGVVGADSELTELAWVTFKQARELDLPKITRIILNDLEERIANGFAPELPVPYYTHRSGRSIRRTI